MNPALNSAPPEKLMKNWIVLIGLTLSPVLAACAPMQASFAASGLDGLWASNGYGLLLEIDRADVRVWQTTSDSCLLAFNAQRIQDLPEGAEAAFVTPEQAGHLTITIKKTASDDLRQLRVLGTASEIGLKRLSSKPSICTDAVDKNPIRNLEVFAQSFREFYPSFQSKKIDWDAAVAQAKQSLEKQALGNSIDEQTLFKTLQGLIAPLQDAHTFVTAPSLNDLEFQGFRNSQTAPRTFPELIERREAIAGIIGKTVPGALQEYANKKLRFGWLDRAAGIGYLRVTGFEKFSSDPHFSAQLEALEAALDQIFMPELRKLVIDVRINPGGFDAFGLAVISRLTDKKLTAYRKFARAFSADQPDATTAVQDVIVTPSTRSRFTGPLVVLTSTFTVSAAETFVLGLMQRPNTIRIGTNTQGAFSDMQTRVLPNGWRFGLPNETYETPNGQRFEGIGIAPEMEVPSFTDEQLAQSQDLPLQAALKKWRK
jgi:Peptidase family S41